MSAALMDTTPPNTPPDTSLPKTNEPFPLPSLTSPLTPTRQNPIVAVFVGTDGLRTGVRWLIYLLMAFILLLVLSSIVRTLRPHHIPIWWGLSTQIVVVVSAIAPAFVMALIEGRPFRDFGLPAASAFRRNFWIGSLWGLVWLSVLMIVLRVAGAFSFGSVELHGIHVVKYGVYYGVFFLLTGFFEEFLVRGYSQWVLTKGMHFWPAATLLSAGFGALHSANPGESKLGLLAAALIGFFFCLTLRRTGDLWWAVGFHMAWDWGESYLYSVPDSGTVLPGHLLNSSFHGPDWLTGGSVGPEGSLVVFAVIGAMWVLFDRLYPEVKYKED